MPRDAHARARITLGLTAATVLLATTACSGHPASFGGNGGGSDKNAGGGENKTVTVAMIDGWDEDVAATYLWKQLLQDRGYTMTIQELDVASTYTGVAQGQVDLYLDAWLPLTHASYLSRYKTKLEILTTWSEGKNMLAVPNYVPEKTIADVAANAAAYHGRIIGIEAGAGLMKATRTQVMPAYGMESMQLVEGSTAAMLAQLDTSIKKKQPVVVTLWQPHWAFSKYPIRPLEDPKDAFGKPDDIQIVATKGYSQKNPEVAGWLKKFKLTQDQLASLTLALHNAGKGNEQAAAKKWAEQNTKVIDPWFR